MKKVEKKRLFINLFILALSFLFFLAIAEIVTRTSGIMGPPYKNKCDIHMPINDPEIVYKLKPNAVGFCTGVNVKINSNGFRDYEFDVKKGKNVFRIAVIGDSITFGKGVELEDTFTKQLERMLNKGENSKYEVLNFGVYGYNTLQEKSILKKYAMDFNPDLVIIMYGLNDPDGTINIFSEIPYIPVISELRPWLNNLYFYRYIARKYSNIKDKIEGVPPYEEVIQVPYNYNTIEWLRTKDALEDMYNIIKNRNIPALIVIFPKLYKLENYPFKDMHKKVEITAKEQGYYVLDLLPFFEGMDERKLWVDAFEDHHPNKEGHSITANAIYEELKQTLTKNTTVYPQI